MRYDLTDYQGNTISLPEDKARKIAGIAELIEIEENGKTYFINKNNIAKIQPNSQRSYNTNDKRIATVEVKNEASDEGLKQARQKLIDKLGGNKIYV